MSDMIYLVANGDLRMSANRNCWAAQQSAEEAIMEAISPASGVAAGTGVTAVSISVIGELFRGSKANSRYNSGTGPHLNYSLGGIRVRRGKTGRRRQENR